MLLGHGGNKTARITRAGFRDVEIRRVKGALRSLSLREWVTLPLIIPRPWGMPVVENRGSRNFRFCTTCGAGDATVTYVNAISQTLTAGWMAEQVRSNHTVRKISPHRQEHHNGAAKGGQCPLPSMSAEHGQCDTEEGGIKADSCEEKCTVASQQAGVAGPVIARCPYAHYQRNHQRNAHGR